LLTDISENARRAAVELCEKAMLKAGQIVVVGCSTSEVAGLGIGTCSSAEIGDAVFDALETPIDGVTLQEIIFQNTITPNPELNASLGFHAVAYG